MQPSNRRRKPLRDPRRRGRESRPVLCKAVTLVDSAPDETEQYRRELNVVVTVRRSKTNQAGDHPDVRRAWSAAAVLVRPDLGRKPVTWRFE